MKIVKRIIIAILLFLCVVFIAGLIKHNIELNRYIMQEIPEHSKKKIRSKPQGTEVHIVGTVHFETDNIKRDDLYQLIDSLSPSIILYEGNSNAVIRMLKKRDYFFQFLRAFRKRGYMEKAVTLKYISNSPNCVVLPYEWEIRDQYHWNHKIMSRPRDMFMAIIELENKNLLTSDHSMIINRYLELSRELNRIGQHGTLDDINNSATDSIVGERQYYQYTRNTEVVNEREELSEYVEFAQLNMNYWDIRNKAMAQNILKQIQQHPNKVIVVLNGFYHRYYLIEELKKYKTEFDFTIMNL